jgi:hypothetical protein
MFLQFRRLLDTRLCLRSTFGFHRRLRRLAAPAASFRLSPSAAPSGFPGGSLPTRNICWRLPLAAGEPSGFHRLFLPSAPAGCEPSACAKRFRSGCASDALPASTEPCIVGLAADEYSLSAFRASPDLRDQSAACAVDYHQLCQFQSSVRAVARFRPGRFRSSARAADLFRLGQFRSSARASDRLRLRRRTASGFRLWLCPLAGLVEEPPAFTGRSSSSPSGVQLPLPTGASVGETVRPLNLWIQVEI